MTTTTTKEIFHFRRYMDRFKTQEPHSKDQAAQNIGLADWAELEALAAAEAEKNEPRGLFEARQTIASAEAELARAKAQERAVLANQQHLREVEDMMNRDGRTLAALRERLDGLPARKATEFEFLVGCESEKFHWDSPAGKDKHRAAIRFITDYDTVFAVTKAAVQSLEAAVKNSQERIAAIVSEQ